MNWVNKVKQQRLKVQHPAIAQADSEKAVIDEKAKRKEKRKKKLLKQSSTDEPSDPGCSESTRDDKQPKEIARQQLSALEWTASLFGNEAKTIRLQQPQASAPECSKPNPTSAKLQCKPVNFEMIPPIALDFEPFWRTEPLDEVRASDNVGSLCDLNVQTHFKFTKLFI